MVMTIANVEKRHAEVVGVTAQVGGTSANEFFGCFEIGNVVI